MTPRVALVVHGLDMSGGVRVVARFARDTLSRSNRYERQLVPLCMSSANPCGTRMGAPLSWVRGTTTAADGWDGSPYLRVGAVAGELESQRYRPRAALTRALAGCDVIQVVRGSPARATAVVGLGKPVALQVAALARVERRQRDAHPRSAVDWWREGRQRANVASAPKRIAHIAVENVNRVFRRIA